MNLTTWGCDKLSQNPKVVHDSKTGAIYVVEEPEARPGTLVLQCNTTCVYIIYIYIYMLNPPPSLSKYGSQPSYLISLLLIRNTGKTH